MAQEQSLAKVETSRLTVLDQASLARAQEEIAVLETYAQEVLVPDVDYGREKGIAEPFLKDPGASKLFNAFNAYARPVVLRADINPETGLILFIMTAEVVSRDSGKVLATGVGTCSTLESKYGTRWMGEAELEDFAINPGEAKRTRQVERKDEMVTEYRVPNPDAGDLVQTLLSMATKRAEVDAAKSLPGVNTALRLLFMGQSATDWRSFWRDMRNAGLSDAQVHAGLGVVSLKDYLAKGFTLVDARKALFAKYSKATPAPRPGQTGGQPVSQPEAGAASERGDMGVDISQKQKRRAEFKTAFGDEVLISPGEAEAATTTPTVKVAPGEAPPPRDPASIRNFGELWGACQTDFKPPIPRSEAIRLLGYKNQEDITEPYGVLYERLWAMRGA